MTALRIIDDHLELASIGSNTHAQIDAKLAASVPYTGATTDVDLGSHDLATTGILSSRGLKILGNYTLAWRNPADTVTNAYLHYDGNLQMRNVSGNITLQADLIDLGTTPLTTSGIITESRAHNDITNLIVENTENGTAAKAAFRAQADGGSVSLSALSAGHITSNQYKTDSALLESDASLAGGLHLSAAGASEIGFWTNGTRRGSIWSDGKWKLGSGIPTEVLDVDGNIAVSGTVDGIDISGIEAGATADQTKADIDALGLSHGSLVDVSANDHHNELHSIASHNDTSATGLQLDTLTDNSIADTLHRHSELVASDGSPDPALSVDASGNVGIGVEAPSSLLEISGATGQTLTIRNTNSSLVDLDLIGALGFRSDDLSGASPHYSGIKARANDVFGMANLEFYAGRYSYETDSPQFVIEGDYTEQAEFMRINGAGRVGMGTASPATSALLDLTSTTGALLLTRMTTTQKNALTAVNGMILYDSTLDKIQGRQAGSWQNLI